MSAAAYPYNADNSKKAVLDGRAWRFHIIYLPLVLQMDGTIITDPELEQVRVTVCVVCVIDGLSQLQPFCVCGCACATEVPSATGDTLVCSAHADGGQSVSLPASRRLPQGQGSIL
jgi:hypothetical protein